MQSFLSTTGSILRDPQGFFSGAEVHAQTWQPAYRYFLVVAVVLSALSPAAWALGVDGASPVNSSLGAQMSTYPLWRDSLLPRFGAWSYPLASLVILAMMHLLLVIAAAVLHVACRLLGGNGPAGYAWKAVCYGLAPSLLLGFVPGLGVLAGVYDTLLQFYVGPATLYQLRGWRAFAAPVSLLSLAIAAYWRGIS